MPEKTLEACEYCGKMFKSGRGLSLHLNSCEDMMGIVAGKAALLVARWVLKRARAEEAEESDGSNDSEESEESDF